MPSRTSDCQRGRRLQLPHSVLRHAGERALVVNGGLLQPQHVVVLLKFDLIPVDKDRTRLHQMQNRSNTRCLRVSPEPVECASPPLRGGGRGGGGATVHSDKRGEY